MNLTILASIVSMLAAVVASGIISVGASTLLTNMGLKLFESEKHPVTGLRIPVYKSDAAEALRSQLRLFPSELKKTFWVCQSGIAIVLILLCIYQATPHFIEDPEKVIFGGSLEWLNDYAEAFIGLVVTLQLIYVFYVLWHVLKFNHKLYEVVGSRFIEEA